MSGTTGGKLFFNTVTSTFYTADSSNYYTSTDGSNWSSASLPMLTTVINFANDTTGNTYFLSPNAIWKYVSGWLTYIPGLTNTQRMFGLQDGRICYVDALGLGTVTNHLWIYTTVGVPSPEMIVLYSSIHPTCTVVDIKQNSSGTLFVLLADNGTNNYLCIVDLLGFTVTVSPLLGQGFTFMEIDGNDVMYLGPATEGTIISKYILTSTDYINFTPQGPFYNFGTSANPTTLRVVSGSTLVGSDGVSTTSRIYQYVYSTGVLTRTLIPCSYDFTISTIFDVMWFGGVYVAMILHLSVASKLLLSTYNPAISGYYTFTVTGDVTPVNPFTTSGITIINSVSSPSNNGTYKITSFSVSSGVSTLYIDPGVGRPFFTPSGDQVEGIFNQASSYNIVHNLNTTWPTIAILVKDNVTYPDGLWHILNTTADISIVDENNVNIIKVLTASYQHYYFKITK
jgi:hypothetical protein